MQTNNLHQFNQNFFIRKRLCRFITLAVFMPCFSIINAQEVLPASIYRSAPDPEALADELFKPRYRAIVINNEVKQQKTENLFAMMINFEFDSTRLLPRSYPLLDAVGEMMNLQGVENRRVIIEGHTDAVGHDEYNQTLSERRALSIKRYLVSRYKIHERRLLIVGKGESDLYDKRHPDDEKNRRVQFRPLS